jgi:hypothetical protein
LISARQARLSRLIRRPGTDLVALDGPAATSVGLFLALSGTTNIARAHIAACARRAKQAVVTSAPDDLARIDPGLHLVVI